MAKIVELTNSEAIIANDDSRIIHVPIAAIRYDSPRVNDAVKIYQEGKQEFVTRDELSDAAVAHSVNKNIFIWIFAFLLGWTGIDRHMRGQHGLGILKLALTIFLPILACFILFFALFGLPAEAWDSVLNDSYTTSSAVVADSMTQQIVALFIIIPLLIFTSLASGIWCLVDWIIALVKGYGSNSSDPNLNFDAKGHYL